ncbi:MAG: molybdopterin molybdotransferase MoeA [Anaerolineae bacterium]
MDEVYRLLRVDEALERVLAAVEPLEAVEMPLLQTLGLTLAEDIHADGDIPPYDNSAMDGYAVLAEDIRWTSGAQPVRLEVIHDLAAGYTTDVRVTPGTAVRIMTGAPIPAGADTVVPFELTRSEGRQVLIQEALPLGRNVRHAGEDVQRGACTLERGAVLGPAQLGMLAALGRGMVRCIRRPRVGILATGDEVVEIDAPLAPGKIRNANSYSNAAQVLRWGGEPVLLGIARDAASQVANSLRSGLAEGIDLLVTSGGISTGDFDVVKRVLAGEGAIDFWQVKMRPGKPLAFGRIGGVPLLGLPGNPVSAMVSFHLFGRPTVLKMMGRQDLTPPMVCATLLEDVRARAGYRTFLRVALEPLENGLGARLSGEQGSGILLSMVRADGLAVVPEEATTLRAGDVVQVMLLDEAIRPAVWEARREG